MEIAVVWVNFWPNERLIMQEEENVEQVQIHLLLIFCHVIVLKLKNITFQNGNLIPNCMN